MLLNGRIYQADIDVSDGAVIRIEKSDCRGAGLYNSAEILTKDASGKYLSIQRRSGQDGSNANEGAWVYFISD